jgi:nitrite reductase/ring-hydroxylating ferredoxin subunit
MSELFAICRTHEIDDGQTTGFVLVRAEVDGGAKPWPILISRKGNKYFGFENICPHEGSRLDVRPGEFLDEEGNFITCGKHRAQFNPDTGYCFIGPCQGKRLTPIELVIDDGDICLTGVALAEEDGLDIPDPAATPEVIITGD